MSVRGWVIRWRMRLGAFLATTAVMLASASVALGHPLHTTITDLGYRRDERTVRITIRVFADDFGRVLMNLPSSAPAPAASAVTDSAASAYVRSRVHLTGQDGRELPLKWCGQRSSGGMVWVCVEAPWSAPLGGLRILNAMLFDLYPDQINIVQASYDGTRASLLFTKGDRAKPLPAA